MKTTPQRRRYRGALPALVTTAAVLSACSPNTSGAQDTETVAAVTNLPTVTAEQCEAVAQSPVGDGLLVIVMDTTASTARAGLPPALTEALAGAAAQSLGVAQIIAVDGPGAAPQIGSPLSLDPMPGRNSQDSRDARVIAAACAAAQVQNTPAPTVEGTDVYAAISTAMAQQPQAMVVISDGINSGGPYGAQATGYDIEAAVIKEIATAYAIEHATIPITWAGLGRTTPGTTPAVATHLDHTYTTLLGDLLTIDTRVGATLTDSGPASEHPDPIAELATVPTVLPETAPAPPVTTNPATPPPPAEPVCIAIPTATLFGPESTTINQTQQTELAPLLEQVHDALAQDPTLRAHIAGHTAEYGTPTGREDISQRRAQAIADLLTNTGTDTTRIHTHAYGSSMPPTPDTDPTHPSMRRVSITLATTTTPTTTC